MQSCYEKLGPRVEQKCASGKGVVRSCTASKYCDQYLPEAHHLNSVYHSIIE